MILKCFHTAATPEDEIAAKRAKDAARKKAERGH
jgi:hypothetical protein